MQNLTTEFKYFSENYAQNVWKEPCVRNLWCCTGIWPEDLTETKLWFSVSRHISSFSLINAKIIPPYPTRF